MKESTATAPGFAVVTQAARNHLAPIGTLGILAVWAFLANRSPTLTYHFAPLLAAAAWPVLERRYGAVPNARAIAAGLGAFVATVGTGITLTVTDRLEGPTLWDSGHAFWEVVLFAAAAAAWAARVASRYKPGLIGALVSERY